MRNLLERIRPLYAPEAGAGGGGGDGAWSAPQGTPAEFVGANAEETLGKMLSGYNDLNGRFGGLRDKLAQMPKAPEKPELYSYQPSEKLKPYFGEGQNPVMDMARQAFHKHGIPQAAFQGVIEDLYGPMAEKGLLPAPFDAKAELKAFGEARGLDAAGLTKALTEADAFAKGLSAQLKDVPEKLKPEVDALLLGLTDTAAGNVLLQALSGRLAENGIRIGGEGQQAGQITAADLKKLDADPRIDPANRNHPDPAKRFDEALRKQYDEAYARLSQPKKDAW